jgi:hypothetical protein
MPLLPLEIPPGVYSVGTDLDSSGRWLDANLVRWRDGSLRPVGGWQSYTDNTLSSTPRSAHAWRTNAADRYVAFGAHDALYVMAASGTISDITPAGLTAGELDAALLTGYGAGLYGVGLYGAPRIATTYSEASTWALDNWGEYLVGCSSADGVLYEWQLNTGTAAAAISGAPTDCSGLAVTEERFLFALGAGGNPRKVQWSDREDNTTWTPSATNEAGDYELQTSGEIMQAVRDRAGLVILTSNDAHVAQYQGPPFVYGFERVGTSCGAVSRQAAVGTDQGVFWMGRRGFYRFTGGAVEEIPCDVHDLVFDNLSAPQSSKVWGVLNAQFSEIWWFYPSKDDTEIDRYVTLNYATGVWSTGALSRTAGVDRGVFRNPIWADGTNLYQHESGNTHGGADVYAETGPISIGAGDNVMYATQLIPDEEDQGEAQITFKTRFYPNAAESTHGPYALGNPSSVRFSGRQVRMRVEGVTNSAWRAGVQRLHVETGGRR